MLPLNDNNAWYYPAPGFQSDEEELAACGGRGNWGKKLRKGARWVRTGKMVAWGSSMDDWEVRGRELECNITLNNSHRQRSMRANV